MSSSFDTADSILCALNIDNDCPGFCNLNQLYVDYFGVKWDVCPACKAHEDYLITLKQINDANESTLS